MKYAVSSSEMKIYDRNTSEHFGLPTMVLMERASVAVADRIGEWISERSANRRYKALIVAGCGNNGGDGVCVARLLKQRGVDVSLCIVGDPVKMSELLISQLKIAANYGILPEKFSEIKNGKSGRDYDIYVDALFGIGLSRPLVGDSLDAVRFINRCKEEMAEDIFVVSVDISSGVSADTGEVFGEAVRSDATVTFNFKKLGHILYPGCSYSGEILVSDVGITWESFLQREPMAVYFDGKPTDLLPKRIASANKGTNGKVLIVAGSRNISGACILAASACIKSGAGMVRVFTAIENAEAVRALLPEAILDVYEDFEPIRDKLKEAMRWSTQAVIGPGIGCEGKGIELVSVMLKEYDKNLVMDADALNIIAEDEELFNMTSNYCTNGKKLILTPHMGEFARLFKSNIRDCKKNILLYPKDLAKKLHATIICKDARSIVADSNEKKIYINVSGNDGMASAGSGDVLSGITGAFINMSMDSFHIAIAAAYIHGRAGDIAASRKGRYSMVASDIYEALPEILE